MSSLPSPARPATARRALLVPVVLAVLAAGCGGGRSPGPSDTAPPTAASAGATPSDLGSPAPAAPSSPPGTPGPTATPAATIPAQPPAAALSAAGAAPVDGALGSYTWLEAGSDAPWIVVPAADAVTGPGPFAVAFEPAVPIVTWTAAWAPISGGQPGTVAGFEEGGSIPPAFAGPDGDGPWSLKLDVRFAEGGQATWYWRLRP